MDKILAAGASIIIRPGGSEGFQFAPKYTVAIEFNGLRNGFQGDNLSEIFALALPWVEEVQFYSGTQWTAGQVDQIARLEQ